MIKTLPLTFKKKGVHYSQLKREGDIAILSLRYTEKGPVIGFDVIKVREYTPFRDLPENGHTVLEKIETVECLQSSEQYGSKAWSFNTLSSAEAKLQELLNVC